MTNKAKLYALMTLVLLVAAGLRLWDLPHLPVGLHYDEAANLILIRQMVENNYRPIFIRAYTGKEVLFFYFAAPWVWLSDFQPWGLRLAGAWIGLLTIAATFAATRALWRSRREVGVFAAAWLAVAFPHLLLSRYGFRAISQPLLQALTVAALWRAQRTASRRWAALGGGFLGLTGYTYLASRLFPIPLGATLLLWLGLEPAAQRRRWLGLMGLALLAAVVTFAPLGLFFLREPATFTTRITQLAAPTLQEALRGVWLCLRALVWPGAGDPYVRFNQPGRPLLDAAPALLAMLGLLALLRAPLPTAAERAARVFALLLLAVMLAPSALATAELIPSNLRMVGMYPFLALLPAFGAWELVRRWPRYAPLCVGAILLGGGAVTWRAYHAWASSAELFYAADGEMVLAAQALDAADLRQTTAYIASAHYRHPTVAALARRYKEARWLTGGDSLVLPAQGDALYLLPRTVTPPALWPAAIGARWQSRAWADPAGQPALWEHRLTATDIAALRPGAPQADFAGADFAHVTMVYDARPLAECHVGVPCPLLVTWEARAAYPALQPVVRLTQRRTGEWARTLEFHYPTEQWTVGDVVLDQFALTLPAGAPPGSGYEVRVGFFDPQNDVALPRLVDERFAGLDVTFPVTGAGLTFAPGLPSATPPPGCAGIRASAEVTGGGVSLYGWSAPPTALRPGEEFPLTLCWHATAQPTVSDRRSTMVALRLVGPTESLLFEGLPANGYAFAQWQAGEWIEDRYFLRVPRTAQPGSYTVRAEWGAATAELGPLAVTPVTRTFAAPEALHPLRAEFGGRVALLGYTADVDSSPALKLTLYWQALAEMDEDYTVFVHLLDAGGALAAQVDEGPQQGRYPTSLWQTGEVVADTHLLALPAMPAEGTPLPWSLRLGWYRQDTGAHLETTTGDALLIPEITTK